MPGWQDMNKKSAQSAADGSLPLLMACVDKTVKSGDYLGPADEDKGPPAQAKIGGNGRDEKMAAELWTFSEECCRITFSVN